MQSRLAAALTAAVVTVLSVACLGVLFVGIAYFFILWCETALESLRIIPEGWGGAHRTALFLGTAVVALPPIVWFGVALFRHSYDVERKPEAHGLL